MKIIILGAGQVGRTAAYHLSREEANDVTVIDSNEDTLRDLQDRLDIRTVSGNAASPRVLEAAGIAEHRHPRRADQQRRGEHARLPRCLDPVPDAQEDRASALVRLRRARSAVRRERRRRRRLDQPGAARDRIRRQADPLPRRPPGARFRGRTRAARRHPRAAGRSAGRPGAANAARAHSEHRRARGRDLSGGQERDTGRHDRDRRRRRGVLSRGAQGHPRGHARDAARGSAGAARRHRRRRQHRLPARERARGQEPREAHRARR